METVFKLGMINIADPQKEIVNKLTLRTDILWGCSWSEGLKYKKPDE